MTLGWGFWLGALVAGLWAWRDFHEPLTPGELRAQVSFRRYAFGAGVYVATCVLLYVFAERCAALGRETLWEAIGYLTSDAAAAASPATAFSIGLALSALLLIARLPGGRTILARIRLATQDLALFPVGVELLMVELQRSPFANSTLTGHEALQRDLARSGLDMEEIERALGSAYGRALGEAASIRAQLEVLVPERFRRYGLRRAAVLQQLRIDHLWLVRRIAQIEELRTDLRVAGQAFAGFAEASAEADADNRLANLPKDDALALLARHRRVVAELAASQFSLPKARSGFLTDLGYDVPPSLGVPYAPVVVAFAAIFALLVAPAIMPALRPSSHAGLLGAFPDVPSYGWLLIAGAVALAFAVRIRPSEDPETDTYRFPFYGIAGGFTAGFMLMLAPALGWPHIGHIVLSLPPAPPVASRMFVPAFAQAATQVCALLWALVPKTAYPSWSRPTLHAPAWWSWIVCGLLSYITALALSLLMLALFPGLPFARFGLRGSLIISAFSPVVTVGVSALVDHYLIVRCLQGWYGRVLDALSLVALMAVTDIAIQHWIGSAPPVVLAFTMFAVAIGAVIGYLVPATAAAALLRDGALERGVRLSSAAPSDQAPRRRGHGARPITQTAELSH